MKYRIKLDGSAKMFRLRTLEGARKRAARELLPKRGTLPRWAIIEQKEEGGPWEPVERLRQDPELLAELARRSKATPGASLTANRNRLDHYSGNGHQQ